MEGGTPRQRVDAGIAGSDASSLRRQSVVRRAGPNDDPVRIVALFFGQPETADEAGAGFEFNTVAAGGVVKGVLEVVAAFYRQYFAGGWSIGEPTLYKHARQFGGTVKFAWAGGRGPCCLDRPSRVGYTANKHPQHPHPQQNCHLHPL